MPSESEDDVSEVRMQVDEPAAAEPTTLKKSSLPPTPPRVSIPETTFQYLCTFLERNIKLADEDAHILLFLNSIWFTVHRALSEDKILSPRLANQAQFRANVDKIGETSFIKLLKDTASRKSYQDLIENGTSFLASDLKHPNCVLFPEVFLKQPGREWSPSLITKSGVQ